MGNIISDPSGNIKTGRNETGIANKSAFAQNMTDILFELNLLNTGNYAENIVSDTSKVGPRPEFDYRTNITSKKSSTNIDINGSPRHYNADNTKLVDIMGIPYADNSYKPNETYVGQELKSKTSVPNDPLNIITNDSSSYYNLKRGFCNASNSVPIDIIGVDTAFDDPDGYWKGLPDESKLGENQKTNYQYEDNMEEKINNCLTWGDLTPPAGQTFFTTDPETGAKIPNKAIPMLKNSDGTLNIKTDTTEDTLNTIAAKNVYGNPISLACTDLLNKTLINSYVSPKISDYSKLKSSSVVIPTSSTLNGLGLEINPMDPATGLPFKVVDYKKSTIVGKDQKKVFGSYEYQSQVGNSVGFDQNNTCNKLSQDVCNMYYYYDIHDGIIHNPTFEQKFNIGANGKAYENNIRFLNQHIPECRCHTLTNQKVPELSLNLIPENGDVRKVVENKYFSDTCESGNSYGVQNEIVNSGNKSNTNNSKTETPLPILNMKYQNSSNIAYRRQFDPMIVTNTGLTNDLFLYVPNDIRLMPITKNEYVCRISQNINVENVAGNVIMSGISATCNVGGKTDAAGGAAAAGAAGPGAAAGPGPGPGAGARPVPLTSPNAPLSFRSTVYTAIPTKTVERTDPPLNPGDKITVDIKFPDSLSAIQHNFESKYQFSLYLVSDQTKKIVLSRPTCSRDTSQQSGGGTACFSPYTLTIPYLYDTVSNTSGIPYQLVFEDTSKLIQPTLGPIINIMQFSMRINNIELKNKNNTYYLYVGINMNTNYTFPTNYPLRAQITLTPVTSTATPPVGCVATTPTSASTSTSTTTPPAPVVLYQNFPNLAISAASGTLSVGTEMFPMPTGSNKIQPIKYYYSIILAGTPGTGQDTGGYTMLYDNSIPINEKCVVDFSNMTSNFNSFTLSYLDYDDNNLLNLVMNNDTVKYGTSLVLKWEYNSVDDTDTTIDLYYDIGTAYSENSATAVKIAPAYSLNNSANTTSTSSGLLINTFEFICPMGISSTIIFYGIVTKGTNKIISTVIPITPTTGITQFRNWAITPQSTVTNMTLITLPVNQVQSITNYFSLANGPSNVAGTIGATSSIYDYIIYDPGTNGTSPAWYGAASAETSGASSGTTSSAIVKAISPYSPNAVTFANPLNIDAKIKINDIGGINISNITSDYPIFLGASITITYTLTNFTFNNSSIQVMIGNQSDTASQQQITIFSFPVSNTARSGSVTFSVYYDVTINNPCIYLASYGLFVSNKIPIKLSIGNTSSVTLTSGTSIPPYQAITPDPANPKILDPLIFVNSINNDELVNNMNITYRSTFPDNKYYIVFNGFDTPLHVIQTKISLGAINFILPLSMTFAFQGAIPALSLGNTSSPNPPGASQFTNVTGRKAKQLEFFYGNLLDNPIVEHLTPVPMSGSNNQIHFNTLTLDLTNSTISSIINIQFQFTGYSKIYIQNLELIFGNNRLDNAKFNISFISNSGSVTSKYYEISTITLVGQLNTQVSLLKPIPGLTAINYTIPRIVNGKYILVMPLVFLNGYYKLPENYTSNVGKLVTNAAKPVVVAPIVAAPPSGTPIWIIALFIIIGIAVISGAVYVYFTYIKKNN